MHDRAVRFNLLFIMEGNRLQRQDGFAGRVYGLDLLLEPARGDKRADLVVRIDVNCSARRDRGEAFLIRVVLLSPAIPRTPEPISTLKPNPTLSEPKL